MWKLHNSKNKMKNPTGNKLEKLVFGMFDQMVEGADKYVTKQGSTWLIFTEDKRWVIEFTNDKTLWFNYNLFQSELELIGKDCTQERDLIKNWFESRFLGIKPVEDTIQNGVKLAELSKRDFFPKDIIENGVRHTINRGMGHLKAVEDTIENGVKHTEDMVHISKETVEDTIQNGVKETQTRMWPPVGAVDETIQNGVKETRFQKSSNLYRIEDTRTLWGKSGDEGVVEYIIQEGVKDTTTTRWARKDAVENTIQNGVKHTEDGDWLDQDERIDDIIQNGVKETREISNISLMSEIFKVNAKQAIRDGVKELKVWKSNRCEEHGYFEFVDGIPTYTPMTQVKDVLENGVKEIQPLPARDGNRDWGLYYQRQGNLTKPHTEYVKEVIEDSYNHMGRVEGVIRNTDKDGI